MYVCGPTVYNLMHVGNVRSAVVFDTVRRYLLYKGYTVKMVQNFTDVDDKIINRAHEEGTTASEVADKYIAEALHDCDALNVRRADCYPRVTEEMSEIIEMISELVEAKYAYVKDGHVFFDARRFDGYGKLSKKNVDDLLAGARVEVNEQKKSPMDFVLWKPSRKSSRKPGKFSASEPHWASPWGDGRPGWHIECSAMVRKYLGAVDIHGGGEDLIFPHHENEIAQSEALQKESFAKYWMHNGMLTQGNKKMSKSLGNFFTLREIAEKFPHNVIRFFLLSGHYRMPMEFGEELLAAAGRGLSRIKNCRALLAESEGPAPAEIENFRADFEAHMDDDFNTANAISVIFELVTFCNRLPTRGALALLDELCGLLGIKIDDLDSAETNAEIETLVEQRQEARKNKDWAAADKIRDELMARGITLEDTPTGVRWTRK